MSGRISDLGMVGSTLTARTWLECQLREFEQQTLRALTGR